MTMFKITSGKMIVTDPCYEPGTWCAHEITVKNGDWETEIIMSDEGDWGSRVAEIRANHKDHKVSLDEYRKIDATIGVDSGQAGFFDAADYNKAHKEGFEAWYLAICDDTMTKTQTAVRSFGVASSSGYGDGSYSLYVVKKGDIVVATRVVFIDEEEDYEEFG